MIYLTTNSDGANTEGIGAMVQYQLFCYCLAQQMNVEYVFSGFKNLHHWQYYNIDQQTFVDDVNRFFNLPSSTPQSLEMFEKISIQTVDEKLYQLVDSNRDVIVDIPPATLMQYGQSNIVRIEKNNWIKDLQSRIQVSPNMIDLSYKDTCLNVAIHIRKYTQTDCDPSSIRDLYDQSKQVYYCNLIEEISKIKSDKNIRIHVYSQGLQTDFDFLSQYNNVQLHIEEYPLSSLYSMIKSDIFVMANSSLSYIASLYRTNTTYKKNNFYHATYSKNMHLISAEGHI